MRIGSHLAEHGGLTRKTVYIGHREIGSGLMGHGQQMKHRVGRTAHGNVERHSIKHGLTCSYAAGQHTLVTVAVIGIGIVNNLTGGFLEKLATVGMGSHHRTVARKSHTDGLVERVHRIGGKHTRARATRGTSLLLEQSHTMIRHRVIGRLYHYIYQVNILALDIAGLHRTARHKYGGNIETHGCHEHAGGHLVTVGDAHHGVGLVSVDHILDRVGNHVARRKRIKHTVMPHGNTVVNSYRIELGRKATLLFNLRLDHLANLMKMCMTGHKLCE